MLVFWRVLTKYNCTKCTTTTSTTQFLSLLQDKNNSYACNNIPTDLEWIWNWSFIGQQPYQAKDHWWLIKASNDSYFDVLAIHNVSSAPLYKGVKTWRIVRDLQQFKSAKPLLNCSSSKSSLRISYQSSYLRNSRVLRVYIWFVSWTQLIVYQVFIVKHFSL